MLWHRQAIFESKGDKLSSSAECRIYTTLLDSNEGDLIPHASQTIYFANINENKISDRETPVELLLLEPQYGKLSPSRT